MKERYTEKLNKRLTEHFRWTKEIKDLYELIKEQYAVMDEKQRIEFINTYFIKLQNNKIKDDLKLIMRKLIQETQDERD